MKIVGIVVIALILIIGLFFYFQNIKNPYVKVDFPKVDSQKKKIQLDKSGQEVIDKLVELGYFKYTDKNDIEKIKKEIKKSYNSSNTLITIEDEKSLLPKDYRLYFCDGENLYEPGGITEYLSRVKVTFERMGLKLNWSNEINKDDGRQWDHRITINRKEYIAYQGNISDDYAWGIAAKNFVLMLNDQLMLQASSERVYPISGGNDGQIIFLTPEQFDYIKTVYRDKEFRPRELVEWCKYYKIN